MIRPRPPKLRTFLTGLILLVVLPSLFITVYSARERYRADSRLAQEQLVSLVQIVVNEQNQFLAGTRQLLMSLSQLPVVYDVVVDGTRNEHCQFVLSNLLSPHPYYRNFGVADHRGDVLCSAKPMSKPVNIRDRVYFQRTMFNKGFGIGEYQIGRITGQPAVNLSYPLTDETGRILGVVFTALSLDWLKNLTRHSQLPTGTSIQIIDGSGRMLAQFPEPTADSDETVDNQLYRHMLRNRGKHALLLHDEDNVERFYAYAPLLNDEGGIYVAANATYATLTANANAQLLRNLVMLGLLTLATFLAAWFFSHKLFLRRITSLIASAEKLRNGRLETRTGLAHSPDELGYLAQSFDGMAESLQRSNRALQALSACNRTLIHAKHEQALLDTMCRIIVEDGGYTSAWIGRETDTPDAGIQLLAYAGLTHEQRQHLADRRADTDPVHRIALTAIHEGRMVVQHNNLPASVNNAAQHDMIALPITLDSQRDVLCIHANDHIFDAREIELLQEMAQDIAFGIHTLTDRTRREQAEKQIHHLAFYDPLTELPNRYCLEQQLTQLLTGDAAPLALLMININRFNEINNTIGYSHADELLKMFGPRLREYLPKDTFISRTGGDIFAVILPGYVQHEALTIANKIQLVSTLRFQLGELNINIDVSIGLSLSPEHGKDAVTLIRRASLAMHMARHAPDDIYTYDPSLDQDGSRHLTLAADLRRAIEDNDGQLHLHLQPKVDMKTRRIVSVEALCRWQHPVHGAVSPMEFIPLAEHTGLILPLTMWVLQAAIDELQRWRADNLVLPIAVNLSARNLYQPDLVTHITRLCRINDIPMQLLELELTESALMQDPAQCQATLDALSNLGIMLYIDDYGIGYSSLGYIKRLPMSAIKIDKSFVLDMLDGNEAETIIKSTIAMAHELGMTVVAEGVESEAVFEKLAALGCDQAQGYYIARPQSGRDFIRWLKDSPWQVAEPAQALPKQPETGTN